MTKDQAKRIVCEEIGKSHPEQLVRLHHLTPEAWDLVLLGYEVGAGEIIHGLGKRDKESNTQ